MLGLRPCRAAPSTSVSRWVSVDSISPDCCLLSSRLHHPRSPTRGSPGTPPHLLAPPQPQWTPGHPSLTRRGLLPPLVSLSPQPTIGVPCQGSLLLPWSPSLFYLLQGSAGHPLLLAASRHMAIQDTRLTQRAPPHPVTDPTCTATPTMTAVSKGRARESSCASPQNP